MSNQQTPPGVPSDMDKLLDAIYDIWGIGPRREQGTYAMQPSPNPIVTAATAGAQATGAITVSPSGAFVLTKHAVHVTDTAYASKRDVFFTWSSGGSDRRWTNDAMGGHVECIGGSDERPFLYPKPYLFDGASTITITITTIQGAIRWAYVSLIGYRIWNTRALNLTRRTG